MLNKLIENNSGGIGVMAALSFTTILGMGAGAVELGLGYNRHVELQRYTDAAVLAGAMAYKTAGGNAAALGVLQSTAEAVAAANGRADSTVVASIVDVNGASGVQVSMTTPVPIRLASVFTSAASYNVTTTSVAALSQPKSAACLIALGGGTSISVDWGARFDANGCAINANGNIDVGAGTITAASVDLGGSVTGAVTTTPHAGRIYEDTPKAATDPLAGDPRVTSALAKLASLGSDIDTPIAPTDPTTTGGPNLEFPASWDALDPSTAVWKQPTGSPYDYVVPAGTYHFGNVYVGNSVKVKFAGPSTITIRDGLVHLIGGEIFFEGGAGHSVKINGGINPGIIPSVGMGYGQSTKLTFGDGDYQIGSGEVNFRGLTTFGNGNVSINSPLIARAGKIILMGNGAHKFRSISTESGSGLSIGTGSLDVAEGIRIRFGSSALVGAGTYRIGAHLINDPVDAKPTKDSAIWLDDGGGLYLGDGPFNANGHIMQGGGSARLILGQAENHLVNGKVIVKGSVIFGKGRYTIKGDLINDFGGSEWPFTTTAITDGGYTFGPFTFGNTAPYSGYAIAGKEVTFVTEGGVRMMGGAKMYLAASTTDGLPDGEIRDMVFLSETSGTVELGQGSGSVVSGALWLPNAAFEVSGGATLGSGGGCFTLIVKTIKMKGGVAGGTTCPTLIPLLGAFDVALVR